MAYKVFFHHFVRLIIKGGLYSFISLRYWNYRWRSVFPWLHYFRPNSLFTFYSLQHHVHTRRRMHYVEQQAVVVV